MRRVICILFAVLLAANLAAADNNDDGIRVGVTLSGGGARGFAHIGALKVLEEAGLPIDVVTGTSMGAVIGGLYAAGYSAHEIEEIALSGDWLAMIIARKSRSDMNFIEKRWDDSYVVSLLLEGYKVRLPSGLRSGQLLYDYLARKTMHVHDVDDFRNLPIPFACVALNIETGDGVVLDHGDLPTAMRASMSFQSVFTPVETEDGLLVDGGLVRNLPVADAFDLGADIVIGVDVSDKLYGREELESLVNILHQTVLIGMNANTVEQRKLCRMVIDPPLGKMSIADFGDVQFAIDAGEAAARESITALRALADSVRATRPVVERPERPVEGPVAIARVDIEGLDDVTDNVVYRELRFSPPAEITPDALQESIVRLMGTDYFEFIRWHIDDRDGDAVLAMALKEKSENRFRGGLRFDTDQKAHLLLNLTFRNVLLSSSLLQFDALFGEEPGGAATYFLHSRLLSAFGVKLQGAVRRPRFDVFDDGEKVAQYKAWYSWGEAYFGSLYSTWLNAGVGGRLERIEMTTEIGGDAFPDSTDHVVPAFASVQIDNQDETIYPTTGLFVDVEATFASDQIGSDNSFIRTYVDWRLTLPVAERVTILQDLYLGRSWQDAPVGYQFSLGGVNSPRTFRGRQTSFLGVPRDARIGPNAQWLMLGVQWEIIHNIIVQARWNAGNAFDSWTWNLKDNRYINGGGIVFGARLLNARAEISISTSEADDFTTHITVGNDI